MRKFIIPIILLVALGVFIPVATEGYAEAMQASTLLDERVSSPPIPRTAQNETAAASVLPTMNKIIPATTLPAQPDAKASADATATVTVSSDISMALMAVSPVLDNTPAVLLTVTPTPAAKEKSITLPTQDTAPIPVAATTPIATPSTPASTPTSTPMSTPMSRPTATPSTLPTVTPTPAPTPTAEPDPLTGTPMPSKELQLLSLVNDERAALGLPAYTLDTGLRQCARLHCYDMDATDYFSHVSPTYGTPVVRMKALGISFTSAAENIALASSIEYAHIALMASPGHKSNILDPNYTRIGIGVVWDESRHDYLITQTFAK